MYHLPFAHNVRLNSPHVKTVHGEVSAYSPVITRFSPLFFIQVVLVVLYVLLLGSTAAAVQSADPNWYKVFCQWWLAFYVLANALHLLIYDPWIKACHVMTNKGQQRMVIGAPMHLALKKAMLASFFVASGVFAAMLNLFIGTRGFKSSLSHAGMEGTLLLIVMLAAFGIAALLTSVSNQLFPRISVAHVIVYVPVHGS